VLEGGWTSAAQMWAATRLTRRWRFGIVLGVARRQFDCSERRSTAGNAVALRASKNVNFCFIPLPIVSKVTVYAVLLETPTAERQRDLYFSVVTGTRYGTKTPPGQQPTNPCAGDMTRGGVSTILQQQSSWSRSLIRGKLTLRKMAEYTTRLTQKFGREEEMGCGIRII